MQSERKHVPCLFFQTPHFQLSSWFLRHVTVRRRFNTWRRYVSTRPGFWFTPVHPVKGFVVVSHGEEAAIFTSLARARQQLQVHAGKQTPAVFDHDSCWKRFACRGSVAG